MEVLESTTAKAEVSGCNVIMYTNILAQAKPKAKILTMQIRFAFAFCQRQELATREFVRFRR